VVQAQGLVLAAVSVLPVVVELAQAAALALESVRVVAQGLVVDLGRGPVVVMVTDSALVSGQGLEPAEARGLELAEVTVMDLGRVLEQIVVRGPALVAVQG
jgi:methyl coenzyme M reductase subunit C